MLEEHRALGLDYLVPIGGDDTLSFAQTLRDKGVPLVAIPKTMDNDVQGTEYCIGFSTAITRAKELINRQRTTLGSHERIGVFRIFGRDCGFTALYTAYVTSARCLIPEAPFDLDHLCEHPGRGPRATTPATTRSSSRPRARSGRAAASRRSARPTRSGTATRPTSARSWRPRSARRTGIETVFSELTYDLRSGEPDSLDTDGRDHVRQRGHGPRRRRLSGRMIAIRDGKYAHSPLPDPALVPVAWT